MPVIIGYNHIFYLRNHLKNSAKVWSRFIYQFVHYNNNIHFGHFFRQPRISLPREFNQIGSITCSRHYVQFLQHYILRHINKRQFYIRSFSEFVVKFRVMDFISIIRHRSEICKSYWFIGYGTERYCYLGRIILYNSNRYIGYKTR